MEMTVNQWVICGILLLFLVSGIFTAVLGGLGGLIPGVVQMTIGSIGLLVMIKRHSANKRR